MGNPQPPVLAKNLVLAMPKRSIELLYQQNKDNFLFKDSAFLKNIQTVSAVPVFKLFLGYEYPWWRTVGVKAGSSVTDLPMRRCFYFGTEGEQLGGDPKNLRSLMMTSFPDDPAAQFWRPMAYDPDDPEKCPAFEGDTHVAPLRTSFLKADGLPYFEPLLASRIMVQTAQQQLKALHDVEYIPEPYSALYLDWTKDPYGGGWYTWNPHCKPWEVMKKMRHPIEDANLYICGDCYSNFQGWVQGALNSAELMLEENFHLDRPDWLPHWYDLGL
jgi:monoamine oxidase